MTAALKILPHYTYDDYMRWEDEWELIYGVPYAMSPSPVPKHQWVAGNLNREFGNQLKKCSVCKVYQPIDYLVADDTILQPDMLIVCKEITKNYLDFPPALVVEILSPSTAQKDRLVKLPIYEKQGIPYFLIVDIEKEIVEIHVLENGEYKLVQQGKDFSFDFTLSSCEATISFNEIWE